MSKPTTTFEFDASIDESRSVDRARLLSHSERKYLFFIIPEEWIFNPEDGHEVKIENSNVSTAILLVNTMIGAGIIVQPFVFSQAGMASAFIEYLVIGIMIFLGVEMLALCGESRQIFDYSKLTESLLGTYGKLAVDISIVVTGAGALLSYILVIGSLLENIINEFSACTAWYCDEAFITALPIIVFTIPLCLIRQFGHLAVISYISIAVISGVVFLVVIGGPVHGAKQHYEPRQIRSGSFLGTILTIGDIVFALGYATATFHAYNGMAQRNISNFRQVAKFSTACGVFMCFITGLIGYLSFRDDTETNILLNFSGPVGAIFKIALIIHLILYIPGDFVILRASLWRLFSVDVNSQSNIFFVTTTLACICIITIIAILLEIYCSKSNALNLVIDITGGMGGSFVYFLVPGLMGLKLYHERQHVPPMSGSEANATEGKPSHDNRTLLWKSATLLIFGCFIFIIVLISNEI
jgi:amino acid permease